MIDVEQRALRALEQNALAGAPRAIEQLEGRRHVWQHLGRDGEELLLDRLGRRRREAHAAAQGIVMREQARDLAVEKFRLRQIHQADGAPADLVLIGRADAPLGGSDFHAADFRRFAMRVELAMQRKNKRNVFGDLEVFWRHFDALARIFSISSTR